MTVRLEDYRDQFGVSKAERELASALRKEPDEDRYQIIQRLFWDPSVAHGRLAFDLVRKCLTKREHLERILEQGLERGDASTVKYWLKAVVEGLGFRRVVQMVRKKLATDPVAAIQAHYHLQWLLPRSTPRAVEAMQEFEDALIDVVFGNPDLERLLGQDRRDHFLRRLAQRKAPPIEEEAGASGSVR